MANIAWFKDLTKDDIDVAGGKGANLGEMFSKLPIPNGFVVTADAYAGFVASIQEEIQVLLKGLDIEDSVALEEMSERVQNLIMEQKFSAKLVEDIKKAYGKLKGFVAVRSSATAEDLPEASFAGQQATFLNVNGENEVVKAVKKCFASLYTARAIYYREQNKFRHEDVKIAAVVQKMVESRKAGVMFTVNPVTNKTDEVVIEAGFGLGEFVVSGEITPDYYCVEKFSLEIKECTVNEQEFGLFKDKKGNNVKKSIQNPGEQVLTNKEIKELAQLADKIEKHFGKPMDIEFAVEDKIYILQARPVTTIK